MNKRKPVCILSGALALALPAFAAEPTKEQLDFFEGKIRPILSEKCYKCHSLESGKSKGGLTLDLAASALKGGDTGPAVVPGNPEKSLMYTAVTYADKDMQMPPTSSGGKLDAQQIADIATWIKMGAPDPRTDAGKAKKLSGLNDSARNHWAYQPVRPYNPKRSIPLNKNQQWCRTPIDAYILQKIEAKGMLPSPDASREVLLRRAYYDLIGLPPSPAQIEAFLADNSANAWEKVVDGLLASPHYGERWARYWLNSARYADTIGGDANLNNGRADYRFPNAWTYRDYVVRAFNEDKPYNQFIIEQLAADQIFPMKPMGVETQPETPKVTTSTNGKPTGIGKADSLLIAKGATGAVPTPATQAPAAPAQPMAAADPAMMTSDSMMGGTSGQRSTGKEMQGDPNLAALGFLTVGMRFGNANDNIDDKINVFSKAFLGVTVACARCHDHMFDPVPQADYYAIHGVFASSDEPNEEGRPIIAKPNPSLKADYERKLASVVKENRDIYFREVEHFLSIYLGNPADYMKAAVLGGGMGGRNAEERQAIITKASLDVPFTNFLQRAMRSDHPVYGPLKKLEALSGSDFATQGSSLIKEMQKSRRYNSLVMDELAKASLHSTGDVFAAYEGLLRRMAPKLKGFVSAYKDATGDTVTGFTPAETEFLSGPFSLVTAPNATTDWVRNAIGSWNNQMTGRAGFVFAKINDLELTNPGAPSRAMVMVDKPSPKDSNLLIRGQAGTPGEVVPRGFLSILSPEGKRQQFTAGSGRLELARAIADRDNPLTARVLVNRVWLQHFGEGFVRTPDDLGVMSEKPTHPELIDYLAGWFVDEKGANWSLKKLHKFIMLSRVYQASSYILPGSKYPDIDPDNRLLWRANVRRLDFESFRDSLLAMSGRLDPKLGGQPVNITDEPYSYRRSIYGYIDRGNVPEIMSLFDFSDPDMPNSKRTTTVVPQQALFLMNSPLAIDVARRVVARGEFQRADNDLRRVFALYRVMFQRQPYPKEIEIGINFVQKEKNKQAEVNAIAPEIAKKNAEIQKRVDDLAKRDNDARRSVQNQGDIVERKVLQPWEAYAHALLFANEAIYVN